MNQPNRNLQTQVFARDGHRCVWCKTEQSVDDPRTILGVHRIVAGSRGGRYTMENCVTLCASCNSKMRTSDGQPWKDAVERAYINPRMLWTGAFVPLWLLSRPECAPGAKLVYALLCLRCDERTGRAELGQEEIAAALGITDRQIRNLIGQLERCSLLVSQQVGLNTPNEYRFLYHPWMSISGPDRKDISTPDRKDISTPDRKDISGKYLELEATEVNRTSSPRELSLLSVVSTTKSSTDGKKEKLPGDVAAAVDAFRAIPGVRPSGKDGGVIAGLVARYGKAAILQIIQEDGPSIAAADNALLWLAARFKRSKGLGRESMGAYAERVAAGLKARGGG